MSLPLRRTRAAAARFFFRNFFHGLLIAASAALWLVPLRLLAPLLPTALPVWLHCTGIAVFYAINRSIVTERRARFPAALRIYTAFAFICLMCMAFLLVSSVLWGSTHVLAALSQGLFPQATAGLRSSVDATFGLVVPLGMMAIGSLMVFGYTFGQRQLRIARVSLPVAGLRRQLRIAQISDIHVGQNLSRRQLSGFVAAVNRLEPDLICITGDVADGPRSNLDRYFPLLGELRARHGVWAILGNHDHYAGAERVAAALQRVGIGVLCDSAATLDVDGQALHVIGLDDRGRDWARGVSSAPVLDELVAAAPAGVPILLLSHRPDIFSQAARCGAVLTLSGHTHGGQLAVPWFGGRRRNLAELVTPFSRGLFARDGAFLYVNCGLGVTGQRIRLFTPREISLFELAAPVPERAAVPSVVPEFLNRAAPEIA
jgi:predicted MPP superfamily phosphohydrolase